MPHAAAVTETVTRSSASRSAPAPRQRRRADVGQRPPLAARGAAAAADHRRRPDRHGRAHRRYMHRGAEKLFEVRDHRQILVLANRHDWLSAFANELGGVLTSSGCSAPMARVRGVGPNPAGRTQPCALPPDVPRRLPTQVGDPAPPQIELPAGREDIQAVMEEASGGRMHYMFKRVGGLREDLPDGWPDRVRAALAPYARDLSHWMRCWGSRSRRRAPGARRPAARTRRRVRDLRPTGPGPESTSASAATSPTSPTANSLAPAAPAASRPARPGTAWPGSSPAQTGGRLARPRGGVCGAPGPAATRAPINVRLSKGAQGIRGPHLLLDGEPVTLNRYYIVLARKTPWRCKLRAARAAPGVRVGRQTWRRSSRRCPSSWATSMSPASGMGPP